MAREREFGHNTLGVSTSVLSQGMVDILLEYRPDYVKQLISMQDGDASVLKPQTSSEWQAIVNSVKEASWSVSGSSVNALMKKVNTLDLSKVGAIDIKDLQGVLRACPNLQVLDLSGHKEVTGTNIKDIAGCLPGSMCKVNVKGTYVMQDTSQGVGRALALCGDVMKRKHQIGDVELLQHADAQLQANGLRFDILVTQECGDMSQQGVWKNVAKRCYGEVMYPFHLDLQTVQGFADETRRALEAGGLGYDVLATAGKSAQDVEYSIQSRLDSFQDKGMRPTSTPCGTAVVGALGNAKGR